MGGLRHKWYGPTSANTRWPVGGYAALPPGEVQTILGEWAGGNATLRRWIADAHQRLSVGRRPARTFSSGARACGAIPTGTWGKRITQQRLKHFVEGLDHLQRAEAFGYALFFVGDDHRLLFVTIARSDQEFDKVSNLTRDGVFRINIGVSKATFGSLLGDRGSEAVDHHVLDRFLPHPHDAKQNWVCLLNPGRQNAESVKKLIAEAHAIAGARMPRQMNR